VISHLFAKHLTKCISLGSKRMGNIDREQGAKEEIWNERRGNSGARSRKGYNDRVEWVIGLMGERRRRAI
jgi:hypothetical protein